MPSTNKGVIPEKLLTRGSNHLTSRFEVPPDRSSLIRIPTDIINEREKEVVGRVGVEPTTPAMSRRYPNQARPPAQYIMKKFIAQIYVVDRLYVGTN